MVAFPRPSIPAGFSTTLEELTFNPSRVFSKCPVLMVISPLVVSIFPEVLITSAFAVPLESFCITRLLPASISPRWFSIRSANSDRLFPAYSSAVLTTDPAAVSTILPAVPVKPSSVISPWLDRLTSPPACSEPLSFMAIWLPESAVVPPPAVIKPLLVSLPAAFSVMPLPCRVPWLLMSPLLVTVSWLFAATTPCAVQLFTSFSVRLPRATIWPIPLREAASVSRSPPLNRLPLSLLIRSLVSIRLLLPSRVPLFANVAAFISRFIACSQPAPR
ncbi:hypothetical protein D3C75_520750 [compost metagenome]